MRWSIEELIFAWNIYREFKFKYWLKHFFRNLKFRIKLVFKWVFTGETLQTLWDLEDYLLKVIIRKLKSFKKYIKYGYPAICESFEHWQKELDLMIDKFIKMEDDFYLENSNFDVQCTTKDVEVMVNGKKTIVKGLHFETEEDKLNAQIKLQEDNNREAFEMLSKYFKYIWD